MSPLALVVTLLVCMTVAALTTGAAVALGGLLAARRTKDLESRYDRLLNNQLDSAARALNLLLARDPATFGILEAARRPVPTPTAPSGSDASELERWEAAGGGMRSYVDPNDIPDDDGLDILLRAAAEG